jgi:GxxExxY protein
MTYQQDHLTETIIQCIIRVHQILGPGFLESIYQKALRIELTRHCLHVETEKEIPIYYEKDEIGHHRLDMLIEDTVIVELKAVESLSRAHYAQVRSYLKATNLSIAILVNFSIEKADFRRIESASGKRTQGGSEDGGDKGDIRKV